MLRNYQHAAQQLLPSLASLQFLIILKALLLCLQLAEAHNGASSCYNAKVCPIFGNVSVFPFVTAQACGAKSSFLLSGCGGAGQKPNWLSFDQATITDNRTLGPPTVMALSPLQQPAVRVENKSSNNSSISKDMNISANNTSTFLVGSLNLTWNDALTKQNACTTRATLDNISNYLPRSIHLTSFARSSFQFTPANIILLFSCSKSISSASFQKNSPACRYYEKGCNKGSTDCYQYMPARGDLSVSLAMQKLGCESAMFYVVSQLSLAASRWSLGLIELNWSTIDPWMESNRNLCEGCLKSSGTCGYDDGDNFQCYCRDNNTTTNCTTYNRPNEPTDKGCSKSLKCIGLKIAIGSGGFAVALSLSFTIFCIWRRKVFMKTSVPGSSRRMNKSWMKKPSFLWRKQDPLSAKEMSYQEIVIATEAFADEHMLGDGGFGAVYKGVLADGRKVAVKRLYHDNYRRMEHFFNEIKVLSNLNHPNLVKLYGFCYDDEKELLLVFEYASQGTVSDQLHDALKPPMPWKLRLNIACETAEALSYLHNSVVPPIYHRDVKTTNILLDEGFHVKLADFGLSKFVPLKATHVSTAPQGTPGYLDPDYHQCYQLTDKSDVYSLGVVLMELISAKLAVDMSRGRGEINLSTLAVMKIQCGKFEELVDSTLEMKNNPCLERSIKRVVELAFQCLHAEREERPSMSFIAETLVKICREHADDEAEALLNLHINTHSTATACQSCVSNLSNKPCQHSQDSPWSALFSSDSSSKLSSG